MALVLIVKQATERSSLITSIMIESSESENGSPKVKNVYFKAERNVGREGVNGGGERAWASTRKDEYSWTLSNTAFSKILKPNNSF